MNKFYRLFWVALAFTVPVSAQFSQEPVDAIVGVLYSSDLSWDYYFDQMNRFPERIGTICYNAYIAEKAGLHQEGVRFYRECAKRGSTSAMIQMSIFYDLGVVVEKDLKQATQWLKRAAEAGHS